MGIEVKWRIAEMELWDRETMDLLGPAFIEFGAEGGSFRFIAVDGQMSCEHGRDLTRPDQDVLVVEPDVRPQSLGGSSRFAGPRGR